MRRIKKAKITHISLVERGANRIPVLYKSEDGTAEFDTLIAKGMNEKGEIVAIVYAPEQRDAHGDIASAEVIYDMAKGFGKHGKGVDLKHNEEVLSKDDAFIFANYIVKKGDPDFADLKDRQGNHVDATGAWAVHIQIENEDLRKEYREGKWDGVSMFGPAVVEVEKSDDTLGAQIIKALKSMLGKGEDAPSGEIDMDSAELKKMLDEQAVTIAKAVSEALKPVEKVEEVKKTEKVEEVKKADTFVAPKFEGDPASADDLRTYERSIRVAKAQFDHSADPVALITELRKINDEMAEDTSDLDKRAGIQKGDTPEVVGLKRQLAKALQKSNQDTSDPFAKTMLGKSEDEVYDLLAKQTIDDLYGVTA